MKSKQISNVSILTKRQKLFWFAKFKIYQVDFPLINFSLQKLSLEANLCHLLIIQTALSKTSWKTRSILRHLPQCIYCRIKWLTKNNYQIPKSGIYRKSLPNGISNQIAIALGKMTHSQNRQDGHSSRTHNPFRKNAGSNSSSYQNTNTPTASCNINDGANFLQKASDDQSAS